MRNKVWLQGEGGGISRKDDRNSLIRALNGTSDNYNKRLKDGG